ncbi:MAG: PEGA domain-containing protein [Myxococcaceae bacterium]|nr:PEGA domain-containing protein [Myxococcaceae bacterium]
MLPSFAVAAGLLCAVAASPATPAKPRGGPPAAQTGLSLSHQPASATVELFLDGKPMGRSPALLLTTPGPHTLAAEADGFERLSETVEVLAGALLQKELVLKPLTVALRIDTFPPGAEVTADAQPLGKAPGPFALRPGAHALVLTYPGYAEARRQVELLAGKPLAFSVTLELLEGNGPPPPVPLPAPSPAAAPVRVPEGDAARLAVAFDEHASEPARRTAMADALEHRPAEERAALLARVEPQLLRERWCRELAALFDGVELRLRAEDRFGEPVTASIAIDGRALGTTPAGLAVPECASRLELKTPAEVQTRALALVRKQPRELVAVFGDRPPLAVVSAFGDLVTPAGVGLPLDTTPYVMGFGASFEYLARVFYLRVAVKDWLTRSPSGVLTAQPFPLGDFSLGAHVTASAGSTVRGHLALSLGVWSVFWATARAQLGITIADELTVAFSAAFNVNPRQFLVPGSVGGMLFSGGLSLGWAIPTR